MGFIDSLHNFQDSPNRKFLVRQYSSVFPVCATKAVSVHDLDLQTRRAIFTRQPGKHHLLTFDMTYNVGILLGRPYNKPQGAGGTSNAGRAGKGNRIMMHTYGWASCALGMEDLHMWHGCINSKIK